jgi:hypothetical protein
MPVDLNRCSPHNATATPYPLRFAIFLLLLRFLMFEQSGILRDFVAGRERGPGAALEWVGLLKISISVKRFMLFYNIIMTIL